MYIIRLICIVIVAISILPIYLIFGIFIGIFMMLTRWWDLVLDELYS